MRSAIRDRVMGSGPSSLACLPEQSRREGVRGRVKGGTSEEAARTTAPGRPTRPPKRFQSSSRPGTAQNACLSQTTLRRSRIANLDSISPAAHLRACPSEPPLHASAPSQIGRRYMQDHAQLPHRTSRLDALRWSQYLSSLPLRFTSSPALWPSPVQCRMLDL